jgi:hypothetical protein
MATLSFGRPLLIGWRDRVFSPVVKRTYTPFPLAVVAANFRDCVDPSCKLSVFPFKFVSGDHSAITHRHPKPCFDSASNHSSNEPTTRFITISLSEPKAQNVLLSLQDHNMCFFNSSLMNTHWARWCRQVIDLCISLTVRCTKQTGSWQDKLRTILYKDDSVHGTSII